MKNTLINIESKKTEKPPISGSIKTATSHHLVKNILRGWIKVRKLVSKREIRSFRFKGQTKALLRRIAQQLYDQYQEVFLSQIRLVLDPGILKEFFSVQIYGTQNYPLFTYPYNFLVADSLNPEIFKRVLYSSEPSSMNFESFTQQFWYEKRSCRAKFSEVDLYLLNRFFGGIETQSCINFPNTVEVMGSSPVDFSDTTARRHYNRMLNLTIIGRFTAINYTKLGLIPLIKIYKQNEVPSEIERLYTLLAIPLPKDTSLHLMIIPAKSSFWTIHTASNMNIIQSREIGVNVDLFNGQDWKLDFLNLVMRLPLPEPLPTPQWQMTFSPDDKFPFRASDLRLLTELRYSPERQVQYLGSRAGLHPRFGSNRFIELRDAKVFQTHFRLFNVGLNDRYYVLEVGTGKDTLFLYQLLHYFPRYEIWHNDQCHFALVWLPSKNGSKFIDICKDFQRRLNLKEFYYGNTQMMKVFSPNLSQLWNAKGKNWVSEPLEW